MTRERAKLTEKQERILVQCQLMGLTTRDMTQISNRLVALERERKLIAEISEVTAGKTWLKIDQGWKVTDENGRIYECKKSKKQRKQQSWYHSATYVWDIKIHGPDKRFKDRELKEVTGYVDYGLIAKLCPEKSKELYSILKNIHSGKIR